MGSHKKVLLGTTNSISLIGEQIVRDQGRIISWIHERINSEPKSKQVFWSKRRNKVFGLTAQITFNSQI